MSRLAPLLACACTAAATAPAAAQTGTVAGHQKVSETEGGFDETLLPGGRFALALARLPDLDGDGVEDLIVGAEGDDDGGADRGAVYVLFLEPGGTVRDHQKISDLAGGFEGELWNFDRFGAAVASLGDLDGDGRPEVAVGEILDDDGTGSPDAERGAVWILSLDADGTVASETKISGTEGGFQGPLSDDDWFGVSVSALGDLDGDGPSVAALAVGALRDDDGGEKRGAVWILFLDAAGTVVGEQKVSDLAGGFTGELDDDDRLGRKVVGLGDVDGDGVADLAASAPGDDDGGTDRGAVWILFLNPDGTVKAEAKVSSLAGGFTGELADSDLFGRGLGTPGDLDCDGVPDLAVGAIGDDDCDVGTGAHRGAVWILFLAADGSVRAHQKISHSEGGFTAELEDFDVLGTAVAWTGDVNGDGVPDLAAGAPGDDDGGPDRGAFYFLYLNRAPAVGLGTPYCCPAVPHSGGTWARIAATGSAVVADADFSLEATDLPVNEFGYFLASRSHGRVEGPGGSQGVLCLGNPIGRFTSQAQSSGATGEMAIDVDLSDVPLLGAVSPGESWSFQAWFRDHHPGATSNFTDAVTVGFR